MRAVKPLERHLLGPIDAFWHLLNFFAPAVGVGLIVPFVQVAVTLAFAAGGERGLRILPLLRKVLLNPLILGCLFGYVLGWLGGLPPGLKPAVQSLGQASVALGLLYPFTGLLLSPLLAALAMSFSSVTVITNANRLKRWKPPLTKGVAE